MAAVLPTSSEVTSGTQTNAQQKVDFASMLDFLAENTNKGTTAGTTTAYTLTLVPALSALEAGQRFRVKFNAANTSTTPTLNVNGLGAAALKVYGSTGAKENPTVGMLALNMLANVEYDGTDYVVLNRPVPISGAPLRIIGTAAASLNNDTGTYATVTSLAITPASSSNKVKVEMSGQLISDTFAGVNAAAQWQLLRGATVIANGSTFAETGAGGVGSGASMACNLLDAPATGSAVTYAIQIRTTNTSSFSRATSTFLTLTEVQG